MPAPPARAGFLRRTGGRVTVAAAALVLLVAVGFGINGLFGGHRPDPTPTRTASPSHSPSPTASPELWPAGGTYDVAKAPDNVCELLTFDPVKDQFGEPDPDRTTHDKRAGANGEDSRECVSVLGDEKDKSQPATQLIVMVEFFPTRSEARTIPIRQCPDDPKAPDYPLGVCTNPPMGEIACQYLSTDSARAGQPPFFKTVVQDGNVWIQVYERETHHKWDAHAFTDDVLQQWQTFTRFALIQVQQLQGTAAPTPN